MSTKNKRKKSSKDAIAVPKETDKTLDKPEDAPSNEESPLQKFERELAWCIEQLQLGLETQSPDSRQAMEATKVLKILVSAKAPMIKKRQVMRNTFGDYRKKMQEQDRKSAAAAKKIKLLPVEDKGYQKSQFFKKSMKKVSGDSVRQPSEPIGVAEDSDKSNTYMKDKDESMKNQEQTKPPKDHTSDNIEQDLQTSFKFNFNLTNDDDADHGYADNGSACSNYLAGNPQGSSSENIGDSNFKLNPSGNTFRFNFSVTDEVEELS